MLSMRPVTTVTQRQELERALRHPDNGLNATTGSDLAFTGLSLTNTTYAHANLRTDL